MQFELNNFVDIEFEIFARELHSLASIEYTEGFKNWCDQGYPTLPGQLSEKFRTPLLEYYHNITSRLYNSFNLIQSSNLEIFNNAIMMLMGVSNIDIIQVIAFHSGNKLSSISIHEFEKISQLTVDEPKTNISSFLIHSSASQLQIRLKPMNVFTQPSMKVNCAIKFIN
jgi:hypothetical protein